MEISREKASRKAKTMVDRQCEKEFIRDWNTRWTKK